MEERGGRGEGEKRVEEKLGKGEQRVEDRMGGGEAVEHHAGRRRTKVEEEQRTRGVYLAGGPNLHVSR